MEKHNKIAPPMGSTQSLEESADTKAVDTSYIIERMKELDDTNGIVPYVLEGCA